MCSAEYSIATAPLPEAQPWFYWTAYFAALALVWVLTTLTVTQPAGELLLPPPEPLPEPRPPAKAPDHVTDEESLDDVH